MHSNKIHLSKLPNLKEAHVPPRPDKVSKKGIVLLPLFQGNHSMDVVAHHAAISACWAHRTWRQYSDADDYGIEVKFYIEECVRDSAMPILQSNFIRSEDIIWHDNGHLFQALYPTTAIQKAASYTDERFSDYDWIFDVDSDIFVMSPNRQKLQFFRNFFEKCQEDAIGVSWVTNKIKHPECLTPLDIHWCGGLNDDQISAWKARFENLVGKEMLEMYFDPKQWIPNCNGGIVAIPVKHFMSRRKSDLEFFLKASRDLRDLEAALSVYNAMGNPLFNIYEGIKTSNFHNDGDAGAVQHFMDAYSEGNPFLLHYASSQIHRYWYQGIGILDS